MTSMPVTGARHVALGTWRLAGLAAMVLAVLTALPSSASAQTSQPVSVVPTSQPVAVAPVEVVPAEQPDWFVRSRNPVSWVQWGADQRLRWEMYENAHTLNDDAANHERDYFRFRTRLWSTFSLMDIAKKQAPDKFGVDINTRLAWEWRTYMEPSNNINGTNGLPFNHQDMDEVIFDNLNIKLRNLFNQPLTVTVGRQDIILGDGWLVLDGTPMDGSRTIFFDAVRATYNFKEAKTVADLIYIDQHTDSDWILEPFNAREQPLSNQDERGAILYVSNKSIENTTVDGYFIYKHDELASGHNSKNVVLAPLKVGDAGDIYTFGTRVAHDFDQHWRARGEVAGQFGNKNGNTLCAFGANSQLAYAFKDRLNNRLRFDYEFLSGDDPDTKKNEGFDNLWGRWPRFSEVYAVISAFDQGRPANYTNLHRFGPGWSISPCKNGEFGLNYYLLFADENTNAGSPNFSRDGKFRGQIGQTYFTYKFNEHVSSHVWFEVFGPGDFYSNFRNDTATFARYELVFNW